MQLGGDAMGFANHSHRSLLLWSGETGYVSVWVFKRAKKKEREKERKDRPRLSGVNLRDKGIQSINLREATRRVIEKSND
jgi:hypothetical protein